MCFWGRTFPTVRRLVSKCDISKKTELNHLMYIPTYEKFESVSVCSFREIQGYIFGVARFPFFYRKTSVG